ncbi:MAG: APC family permease [Terriglobia bacterium]
MASSPGTSQLRRRLALADLILYGIVIIQPTAPMPIFGVVSQEGHGHVVVPVLLAMVAMLLTATSYGRMARVYPSAGSAYTYVAAEFGNTVGYLTGWVILLDYLLNPIICTIWCSKAAANILPMIPIPLWSLSFALLFTLLNLRGIEASARTNFLLAGVMSIVVIGMLICMCRYILHTGPHEAAYFGRPFYDPSTFTWGSLWTGTSVAALTYIGFDSISTLSEEAINPTRNILYATVLTCLVTGVLASAEVYAAQLVWPHSIPFPDLDTAYVFVAGRAGGKVLFNVVNATLLIATMGSGIGTQLGAARLLYGMGRDNALPRRFFGAINPKRGIPANNVIFIGALALGGSLVMSFQLGAELLNFGAFLAFMGVNAATIVHYFVKGRDRRWSFLVLPLGGFLVCFYTWVNLRWTAKLAGCIWLAVGILYGIYRYRIAKVQMKTVTGV